MPYFVAMYQALSILCRLCTCFLLLLVGCKSTPATDPALRFVSDPTELAALLTEDATENYFADLNANDLRLQMHLAANDSVNLASYRAWLLEQLLPWPADLQATTAAQWTQVLTECRAMFPELLPQRIDLVLGNDQPYGSRIYFTRNSAVVMPVTDLQNAPPESLLTIFRHELFHLISRENLDLRPQLYALANFVPAPANLNWPAELYQLRLTNPDAPNYAYVLRYDSSYYLPILHHPADELLMRPGGEWFSENIRFDYYLLKGDSITTQRLPEWKVSATTEANSPYIIHAEEIIAEHFALLLAEEKKVDFPQELTELRSLLEQAKHQ